MSLSLSGLALADDIVNNVDTTVDATAEELGLTVGDTATTVNLYLVERDGDGKNGCNLTGQTSLQLAVRSSDPAKATVSPPSVTFTSCGDSHPLTVTPVGEGSSTISLTETNNTTGRTFALGTATFVAKVGKAAVVDPCAGRTAPAAPTINPISQPAASGWFNSASGVAGSTLANASNAEYRVRTNGGAWGTWTVYGGEVTFPNDGAYDVEARNVLPASTTPACQALFSTSDSTDIDVDRTAPAISGENVNNTTWRNSDLAAGSFTATDATSGLANASDTPFSLTASAESTKVDGTIVPTTVSKTVADKAGNRATRTVSALIDRTNPNAPTTSLSSAANAAGWHKDNVTVSFAGAGDNLTSVTCSPPATVSNETASELVSGTCADTAGNTSSASSVTVKLDKTPPAVTPGDVTFSSWRASPLPQDFTSDDTLSGLASTSDAAFTLTASGESANADSRRTDSRTVVDVAGNTTTRSVSALIDLTDPTISNSVSTATGSAGWHVTAPTVTFTCNDAPSGVASCLAAGETGNTKTLAEGADQSVTGTATDKAGRTASSTASDIDVDLTAPAILDGGPAAGANGDHGWYTSSITNRFTSSDMTSGLADAAQASFSRSSATAQGAAVTIDSGTVADVAGNSRSSIDSAAFKIDLGAPSVAYVIGSATAGTGNGPNSAGWYKAPVTATFRGTDSVSGFDDAATSTLDLTSSSGTDEGSSVPLDSPGFTDWAGNSTASGAASHTVKIDMTKPAHVSFTGGSVQNGATYYYGQIPARPTGCTATDALSNIASCSVTGSSAATVGSHTLTATATDNAGNAQTATLTYWVKAWNTRGFFSPVDMNGTVNTVKGGSTVPLKFEVFAGTAPAGELTTTAAIGATLTSTKISCLTGFLTDEIETLTSNAVGLRYDETAGQFVFNWRTPAGTGCHKATVTLADGTSIAALFKTR